MSQRALVSGHSPSRSRLRPSPPPPETTSVSLTSSKDAESPARPQCQQAAINKGLNLLAPSKLNIPSECQRRWRTLRNFQNFIGWILLFLFFFFFFWLFRQINKEPLAHLLSYSAKENNFHRRQSIKLQTWKPDAN